MKGGERFSVQLRNPITEIVLMFRDKSSTLTVKGVEYIKVGVADVAVMGGGLGDLGHIAGIGYLATPAHPVPSSLLWMAALSAIPP